MDIKNFYVHLGKLLYAVAMADGEVQDEEMQALYKLVISELSDEALFNQEQVNVFFTEFEFEALMDRKASRNEAFQLFLSYFDENYMHFTPEMKKVTIYAVEQIAKSYNGIVAEEEEMLVELKSRLKLI